MTLTDGDLAAARRVVESVPDPELPMLHIGELGMVAEVRRDANTVVVIFCPTYSGCPATELIQEDIARALRNAGFTEARIVVRRRPAWTTDWIRPSGHEKLRAAGIAPPPRKATLPIFGTRQLECPRCASTETERLAEHGSTPCKALYRCGACFEPFDHFKCH